MDPTHSRNPRALLPEGTTPTTRGQEKRAAALRWLLRWHYTSNSVLCDALGIEDSGYLAKLAKRGLVQSISTPMLPGRTVYALTLRGVSEALAVSDEFVPYPRDPLRLNHSYLRHNLAVQRAVCQIVGLQHAIPERLLTVKGKPGEKHPDALVMNEKSAPYYVALEVELTPKYDRELDHAFLAHVEALTREDYGFVIYTSPSKALLDRYHAHLCKPIRTWAKAAADAKWKPTGKTVSISEVTLSRFVFIENSELLKGL